MGIQDRDWYRDAIRQKELQAQRTQQPEPTIPSPLPPQKPRAHWTLMLMFWVALLIIGIAVARQLGR
jgi:hypothetical protein